MIGSKVWFKGNEVTITSAPYMLYGGEFVDAVTSNGEVVTIATDKQRAANASNNSEAWSDQQEQFKALSNV